MADIYTPGERSRVMSAVGSRGTALERRLARILDAAGIQYSEQAKLEGTPDFVTREAPVAIFANGCFWHGHSCKKGARPVTGDPARDAFWLNKITTNRRRDARVGRNLRNHGYAVITVWECELKTPDVIVHRVASAMRRKRAGK